jgi:carbon monoxide dehydrogenase subunit G
MTIIESDELIINKGDTEVFDYLIKPENYRSLMPSSVQNFEVVDDKVSLELKGLGKLVLAISEKLPTRLIKITPASKPPFDFFIQWDLTKTESGTKVKAKIEADLNMMMKMMAQGFLKDFVNSQVFKLKSKLENQ